VKAAFFNLNKLYLTLQTDFAARLCCSFSVNDVSFEQVCPPPVYPVVIDLLRTRFSS